MKRNIIITATYISSFGIPSSLIIFNIMNPIIYYGLGLIIGTALVLLLYEVD